MRIDSFFMLAIVLLIAKVNNSSGHQANGTLVVQVRSNSRPVEQAEVTVGDRVAVTNDAGEATLEVPAGNLEVKVERYGFKSQTTRASVAEGTSTRIAVELQAESVSEEQITVTATRSYTRIEDEPLRVEVLNQEEVEEKALMTPGDIAMLLNETSGLRVQVTSPSLTETVPALVPLMRL